MLAPQRFDLLGKIATIERIEAAFAKMPRLPHKPGIKVVLVLRAHRLVTGREIGNYFLFGFGHGSFPIRVVPHFRRRAGKSALRAAEEANSIAKEWCSLEFSGSEV